MVRILHVVHTMECGGIETMLMNIYRLIDKNVVQFDFLVNGFEDNYYTEEILQLGGKIYNVTPKRENFLRNIIETINVMKENNYSIVHVHQDSMISFAVWCAKKAGIKSIYTHAHTTSAIGWYRKMITFLSRNYICKNATMKFACSNAAAIWIYGKKEKDYIILKNAIHAHKFQYDEKICSNNRKKLGINEKLVIGTCGRLSVEKNQKLLIEILKDLKSMNKDAILILVGDGEEKNKLIELAESLGVMDSVIITGMVKNVDFYYSVFDCFLLPSFYEGLPLAGVEAQAAGLPCIFSLGVTKELMITPNVSFLDVNKSSKVWAEKILEYCEKKEDTLQKIKDAGYDISDNVKYLQNLYLEESSL